MPLAAPDPAFAPASASPDPASGGPRPPLERLPGRGSWLTLPLLGRVYQLWLADDHLLVISREIFQQEASRFLLADIQTLRLHRTRGGMSWNIVLGGLGACTVLGVLASREAPWSLILAGIVFVPLAVNLVRGPTCAASLQTALGPQRLYALGRLRLAQRVFARLAARIEAVQGALSRERLAEALGNSQTGSPEITT